MGRNDQTAADVSALKVHTSYLTDSRASHDRRISSLERCYHRHSSLPADLKSLQERVDQMEAAVRTVKTAVGLALLALASSGTLGGVGEKLSKVLLGL